MTIAEKIEYAADKKVVTFFKEGLFYKCYNEDAMVFTKKVRAYKVKVKYVKNVGSKVLSLGFPISEIEKENLKLQSILEAIEATNYIEKPYGIVFSLKADIKKNYLEYCDTIQISTDIVTEKQFEYNKTTNDLLVKMILEFDLANSTPLQGLVFIQELKKHIKTQD
jgi:hypothetical protein